MTHATHGLGRANMVLVKLIMVFIFLLLLNRTYRTKVGTVSSTEFVTSGGTDSQPFRFREIGAVWKFKICLKPAFVSKISDL